MMLRLDIPSLFNSQPPIALFGYPSVLARLASERRAGRLRIAPIGITSAPPDSMLMFNDDLCIIELVDADNRPVPPGVASTKVLLTNLYNLVQPLIRYELADVFVRQSDAPDHGHLQAHVQGRADEVLRYEDVDVHPHVARSVLLRTPDITDCQVRQTARGIDVNVIAAADAPSRTSRAVSPKSLHTPDLRSPTCASRPSRISHATPRPASCAATCRYPPREPSDGYYSRAKEVRLAARRRAWVQMDSIGLHRRWFSMPPSDCSTARPRPPTGGFGTTSARWASRWFRSRGLAGPPDQRRWCISRDRHGVIAHRARPRTRARRVDSARDRIRPPHERSNNFERQALRDASGSPSGPDRRLRARLGPVWRGPDWRASAGRLRALGWRVGSGGACRKRRQQLGHAVLQPVDEEVHVGHLVAVRDDADVKAI